MPGKQFQGFLSYETVTEILRNAEHTDLILVGGQAVLMYAKYFNIESIKVGVSGDIDFLGMASEAQKLAKQLGDKVKEFRKADLSDHTINTATLVVNLNEANSVLIDFIGSVGGLKTEELRERALEMEVQGKVSLKFIHPFDLLASKAYNATRISARIDCENTQLQLKTSAMIAASYLKSELHSPDRPIESKLALCETYFNVVKSTDCIRAQARHGLDFMEALELNAPNHARFKNQRLIAMKNYHQRQLKKEQLKLLRSQ